MVGLGLGVSALVGFGASQSSLAEPALEIVMYSAGDSQAQLYYSDLYSPFGEDRSLTLPTVAGVNNLLFELSDPAIFSSDLQRFDPCECATPTMFERISFSTPLYSERIPPALWGLAGDSLPLEYEGASPLLNVPKNQIDPQLLLFLNFQEFAATAQVVVFWVGFAGTSAVVLIVVGLWAALRRYQSSHGVKNALEAFQRRVHTVPLNLPLSLGFVAAIILSIAVVQQFLGAYQTGVTIDEPAHVRHLTTYFETGDYASAAYGPFTTLLGHFVNVMLGVESWGIPTTSAEAYANRHLVVAFIGFLGVAGVTLTGWLVFGSLRWALIAGAFLGSLPVWVGHSMFNLKDIPVATGYTLVTTGLIALFATRLSLLTRLLLALGTISLGTVIAVGTRPGTLPILLVSVLVAGALWLILGARRLSRLVRSVIFILSLTVLVVSGVLFIRLTETGQFLLSAIERSIDFPWAGFNLYAGERVTERPGVSGVATVFLAYLPTFMIFLIVVGLIFAIFSLVRRARGTSEPSVIQPAVVLLGAQGLGVFAVIAILDPVIYDGARQILFVFPALALFAVLGLYAVVRVLPFVTPSSRFARRVVVLVVTVGLTFITYDQVRLFPYNYGYFNEVAQGPGISGRWESDYWVSAMRESTHPVAPSDPIICGGYGDFNFNIEELKGACGSIVPYVKEGAIAEVSSLDDRQFWVIRPERMLAVYGAVLTDNCELHSQVTRPLRGEQVVMSRTYVCDDV
jgi:hypothetical protein